MLLPVWRQNCLHHRTHTTEGVSGLCVESTSMQRVTPGSFAINSCPSTPSLKHLLYSGRNQFRPQIFRPHANNFGQKVFG